MFWGLSWVFQCDWAGGYEAASDLVRGWHYIFHKESSLEFSFPQLAFCSINRKHNSSQSHGNLRTALGWHWLAKNCGPLKNEWFPSWPHAYLLSFKRSRLWRIRSGSKGWDWTKEIVDKATASPTGAFRQSTKQNKTKQNRPPLDRHSPKTGLGFTSKWAWISASTYPLGLEPLCRVHPSSPYLVALMLATSAGIHSTWHRGERKN